MPDVSSTKHPTQDVLCIYHANCADGFTSAWIVRKFYGDQAEYHPGVHGAPPPDVTGKHVLLVDFSYKPDVMIQMAASAASVTVIDHHKTAAAGLLPLLEDGTLKGVFDMEHSGAALTWMWFFPDLPVPRMVKHVEDRDLWKFILKGTREIQATIFSYPYDFKIWDDLAHRCEDGEFWNLLFREGEAIERKHHKDIMEMLPLCTREMLIGDVSVPVANMPYTMAADAANILAVNAPFAACYFDRKDARVFSLRSAPGGTDVSAIAALYGGGGHENAAGFQVEIGWEGDFSLIEALNDMIEAAGREAWLVTQTTLSLIGDFFAAKINPGS